MESSGTRIGTEIAGFRIESVLGRGGMSVVYLAEQTRLGRKVALKILASGLLERDGSFRNRFLQESHVAAGLDHPNVIPIYDAGEEGGSLYIAMRYVEGRDLAQILEQEGRLGLGRTIFILHQVAGALDAAHEHGLVHRDVKPANVLLVGDSDRCYLTDFGVAKPTTSGGLTRTGFFIGTPDYSAPEQIEGREVDARTDVYSLGAMLYSCLTGLAPYARDTEVAVLQAHLLEPPPKLKEHRPELPRGLDRVIAKAMAKSKDDRYATCGDLMAAAEAAAHERPSTAPAEGSTLIATPESDAPAAIGSSETVLAPDSAAAAAAAVQVSATEPAVSTTLASATAATPQQSPPPEAPTAQEPAGRTRSSGTNKWILVALVAAVAVAAALAVVLVTRGGDGGSTATTTGTNTGPTSTPQHAAGLLGIVPKDIFKGCTVQAQPAAGAVQTAVCGPSAATGTVFYPDRIELSTFATTTALEAAYSAARESAGVGTDFGRCDGSAWAGEGEWLHSPAAPGQPGKPGGRRFCYFDGNFAVVVWAHEKFGQPTHVDFLGIAREGGSDHARLFSWWRFWTHRMGKCQQEGCTATVK
jgi:serine/threonine protein kinase